MDVFPFQLTNHFTLFGTMSEPFDFPTKPFAEFEEPDICIWRLHGEVTEATVHEFYAAEEAFLKTHPHLFVLVDIRHPHTVSPNARKVALKDRGHFPVRATATVGGSLTFRTMAALVAKAVSILHPKRARHFRSFDTEEEAKAWFAQRRLELASEQDTPPPKHFS